ncbi:hypothetical protein FFLO_06763 [Filobasidium floriforme]|uniref:Uncharacterized protein n=1 Tax=Filobasidium floriforme TaxID=5210 RepID=A0A8K0NLU0_9TREE|nr:uncharacterized protein HD553DRAFT_127916 [Filobasidium floriforme]KAG7527616.1 hypothetical protein FFLO_06763 [Filobasidium floriforme]KAH8080023.1 hypothetical protein HD553DRAFT_127916 [Filobasidium floriforme]
MRSTVSRASDIKSRPLNDTTQPRCPVVSVRHSERPLPHSNTLCSRKCCAATETHVCLERRVVFRLRMRGNRAVRFDVCPEYARHRATRTSWGTPCWTSCLVRGAHPVSRLEINLASPGFSYVYGPRCVDCPRRTEGDNDPHHHMSDVHVSRIFRRCHRRGHPAKQQRHVFGRLCLVPPSDRTRILVDGAVRRVGKRQHTLSEHCR